METKKTNPSDYSQQIYEKVCAMEKMLKKLLDEKPPIPTSEKCPCLVVAGPDLATSIIRLEDAPEFLPCFDEADMLYGFRDIPVLMSYCPGQVLHLGEESYLSGPAIFFRVDEEGKVAPLTVEDLYRLTEFLETHSAVLIVGDTSFMGIRFE